MRRVILLTLVSLAASCAPVKVKPVMVLPQLPPPCDVTERGNLHRYDHCLEQMTVKEAGLWN